MQSQTHLVGLLQAFGDLIPNTSHLAASDLASRCPYDLDLLKIRPTRQIHGDTKDPVHRRVARILDVLLAFSGCSASSNDSMTMSLRVTPNLVRMFVAPDDLCVYWLTEVTKNLGRDTGIIRF
ncbi:hypothetical protein Moror_6726 [Moniliophthora roreri MCA 2997]|uniref:Uncharacterized protein n=1 Tax=Moniliophthora roreri (strain MCA 2997) TaxID=1381753 RepID=V2YYE3_MONRO|nr:hypothetical protein Moror_6726 [Moniliophthora roreri MCA 2997]